MSPKYAAARRSSTRKVAKGRIVCANHAIHLRPAELEAENDQGGRQSSTCASATSRHVLSPRSSQSSIPAVLKPLQVRGNATTAFARVTTALRPDQSASLSLRITHSRSCCCATTIDRKHSGESDAKLSKCPVRKITDVLLGRSITLSSRPRPSMYDRSTEDSAMPSQTCNPTKSCNLSRSGHTFKNSSMRMMSTLSRCAARSSLGVTCKARTPIVSSAIAYDSISSSSIISTRGLQLCFTTVLSLSLVV